MKTFTSQSTPNHACEESRLLGEIFCDASKIRGRDVLTHVPGSALKLELKKSNLSEETNFLTSFIFILLLAGRLEVIFLRTYLTSTATFYLKNKSSAEVNKGQIFFS